RDARPRNGGREGSRGARIRRGEPGRRGRDRASRRRAPSRAASKAGTVGRPMISRLYTRVLEARARRYASGKTPSERLSHPVISVGNLTMGGTGKTPFVAHLARRLRFEGKRPAILSRG